MSGSKYLNSNISYFKNFIKSLECIKDNKPSLIEFSKEMNMTYAWTVDIKKKLLFHDLIDEYRGVMNGRRKKIDVRCKRMQITKKGEEVLELLEKLQKLIDIPK